MSLVGKGEKKTMPNHLEDIKCQQAEEGEKNHLLFLMVLLLHLMFVVVVPSSFS